MEAELSTSAHQNVGQGVSWGLLDPQLSALFRLMDNVAQQTTTRTGWDLAAQSYEKTLERTFVRPLKHAMMLTFTSLIDAASQLFVCKISGPEMGQNGPTRGPTKRHIQTHAPHPPHTDNNGQQRPTNHHPLHHAHTHS